MSSLARFLAAFHVYAVADLAWVLSPPAVALHARLHERSGNDWSFGKPPDTWGGIEFGGLLVFFALIGLANAQLVIGPAIRRQSVRWALRNGFLLGCAAYATYSVPLFMSIRNWPAALVPIDILTGGVLSLVTSGLVTFWAIRRQTA